MFCLLVHFQVAKISYLNVTFITIILLSFMLFLHMISGITGVSFLKTRLSQKTFPPMFMSNMRLQVTFEASLYFAHHHHSLLSWIIHSEEEKNG